jgi:site-specific DNA recombinase
MSSVDEPMLNSSAAGKFSLNVLGALNQFYSENQSEKIKYRMRAAVEQGRFVNRAPIGCRNVQSNGTKSIVIDREREPLIKKSFELVATGSCSSDVVLRTVTALGLRTPNGLVLPKQSFSKMLKNPIYAGWVCFPSSNLKCRGNHEAIVSEEMFNAVQDVLTGKRAPGPKQKLNPDFPLSGFALLPVQEASHSGSAARSLKTVPALLVLAEGLQRGQSEQGDSRDAVRRTSRHDAAHGRAYRPSATDFSGELGTAQEAGCR